MSGSNPIVLYDGVCGLCNASVQFLLKHDKRGRLRFASLQSDFAETVLRRHGLNSKDLDTLHVVDNFEKSDERVWQRSDAVLRAGRELGGLWGALASIASVIPRTLRDLFYRLVARNRYSIFGKYETCLLPEPNQRSRFLDI